MDMLCTKKSRHETQMTLHPRAISVRRHERGQRRGQAVVEGYISGIDMHGGEYITSTVNHTTANAQHHTMHAVLLGASKGVGYFTALYLLEQPDERWTCTLLLRNPTTLSTDPQLKTYIDQGRLSVVKGDATSEEDVGKFFGEKVTVDVVISSIGESLIAHRFSA